MEVRILGPLCLVDRDGNEVTPRGAQQRRALAALAAGGPAGVSVDALVELLWPAGAPSRNALQALMSKLRKVVAPASIESDGRVYRLVGATTDVDRFEELAESGEMDAAEQLVRGRALTDLDGEAWGAAERTRLDEMVRRLGVRRLERLVETDPDAAVEALEVHVVDEPLDERWWALLMTAHVRAGRQTEALRAYSRARGVLADELGLEPGPELRMLEAQVLAGGTPTHRPGEGRLRSVPARLSSVLGRDEFVAMLDDAARRERLVTIVGPGGAGKTTTALVLARRWSQARRAAWCELSPVGDRDGVVRQILWALGVPESDTGALGSAAAAAHVDANDAVDRIVDVLAASPTTLVLDNCEHLVDSAADVAHRILAGSPDARIVTTSREPLGIPGEHVVQLPPLDLDQAVALFRERATSFGATADELADTEVVSAVCERLDRLPLALELAAARVRSMTVTELHDGLDDRFGLLDGGIRTVDRRQQTLRAVVDWSYDLLEPDEQRMLGDMSVFAGGAGLGALTSVVGRHLPSADAIEVADVMTRLVNKSLVVATPSPWGMRFDLLDTIRAYAREKLDASGRAAVVLRRHARHVADFVAPAERGLVTHAQGDWISQLAVERANIDAALTHAIDAGDGPTALSIAAPLSWYFYMIGEMTAGADLLDAVLALPGTDDPARRAHALGAQAWLTASGPELDEAWELAGQAAALLDRVDDPWVRAIVHNHHAMVSLFSGRLDLMAELVDVAIEAAAAVDDPWIWGITRLVQGEMLEFVGKMRDADVAFSEAITWFERCGDRFAFVITSIERSEVAEQFGEYDRAVEVLEAGVGLAEEIGFSGHALAMRARLGNVETLRGNLEAAEGHHRALIEDPRAARMPWLVCMAHAGLSMIARRRGDLDAAASELAAAWGDQRARRVPFTRSFLLVNRGYLADQLGDARTALRLQLEALAIAGGLGAPLPIAYAVEGCAGGLALHDDPAAPALGARLLGHADAMRRHHATAMPDAERFDVGRAETRLRVRLQGAFDDEFAAGAETALDELRASIERFVPSGSSTVSDPTADRSLT